MNIQDELIKIHNQFGTSEMANYEIQKLFDKENDKLKRAIESWKKEEQINNEAFAEKNERIQELENRIYELDILGTFSINEQKKYLLRIKELEECLKVVIKALEIGNVLDCKTLESILINRA